VRAAIEAGQRQKQFDASNASTVIAPGLPSLILAFNDYISSSHFFNSSISTAIADYKSK